MREITAHELRQLLQEEDAVHLIDVREPYEHEEQHIGGTNIPLGDLAHHLDEIKAMSHERDIVLYCRSGNRSSMAQKMLSLQHGIDNTMNLAGGILSWKKEMES